MLAMPIVIVELINEPDIYQGTSNHYAARSMENPKLNKAEQGEQQKPR